ncbi:uncharacterized protein LOC112567788 isoform X2 [Pomacea canaliculata]|uniref:uncharacterized protein LOC112567788 isoform X2 n=1 Tax=Pomacea canaliculata TaxID=400727 RepID=UPI000D739B33|nr:uncharacterized protein LOC112567788 isoform X2 [Pomacea canaliculata]
MGSGINTSILIASLMSLLVGPVADNAFCVWEEANSCIKKISANGLKHISFEVFHRFPNNTKANLLFCDWQTDHFECQCGSFNCIAHVNGTFEAVLNSFDNCDKNNNLELGYGPKDGIKCRSKNDVGTTSPPVVNPTNDEEDSRGWIVAVILVPLCSVAVVAAIIFYFCKKKGLPTCLTHQPVSTT